MAAKGSASDGDFPIDLKITEGKFHRAFRFTAFATGVGFSFLFQFAK